jgi:hypothetical protein
VFRTTLFVIPAKAGIHFALALNGERKNQNQNGSRLSPG